MNLPLVTPENAPRDAAGLQLLSRPKRYNLALAMGMFPNESPEEQAFIAADDQTQVQALQGALAHRDAIGGVAPQQYAPAPQQYAPAPQQYAPAPVPQYAPPPPPQHAQPGMHMQAPVVPQPMVMTPQPLAMPPQYPQPGMQPGYTPPQPGYALPPAPQFAPPSGRLPPAPQVAQPPQYTPQQMPPQYAPQLPPTPQPTPPQAAQPTPPQAAQPQRVPQTMGDPGNAGQGLSQSAQLNELKGIILGMARTQNMLALLVLELSSHQLGVDKQSLAALAVRNSLAGEPESLFEAAVSLGKAG